MKLNVHDAVDITLYNFQIALFAQQDILLLKRKHLNSCLTYTLYQITMSDINKIKEKNALYYQIHKEKMNDQTKKWKLEHPEEMKIINKRWYDKRKKDEEFKRKRLERLKEWRRKIRRKVIDGLGGKCIHHMKNFGCECIDWRCLQIDHIKGNGLKELKIFQNQRANYYKKVLKSIEDNKNEYQLLCANCNWIKKFENDEL
jgi:hypothetical protein